MAVVTRFTVNQAGMNKLFRDPRQPVVLHQANVGRQLAGGIRREAPRGQGPGPHLADNVSSRLVPSGRGGYNAQVVLGVPHAVFVVKGTRPHSIGSPVLIPGVGWRYIGLSPSGAGKIHPGTKPNNWISRVAQRMGLRFRERR